MLRRQFVFFSKGLLAVIALMAAAPPAMFWLFRARQSKSNTAEWGDAGSLGDLQEARWTKRSLTIKRQNLWRQENIAAVVYVRKTAGGVEAISPICPHAGCLVMMRDNEFRCPCHRSLFGQDGSARLGPSPRPLDPLPCKIEGGRLKVNYLRFHPGGPEPLVMEF